MIVERLPIVAAPMAGGASTPELVAAVSATGATGFLAAGYLSENTLAEQITRTRELTAEPFGVNLFVPGTRNPADLSAYVERVRGEADRYGVEPGTPHWDDDDYQAKVEMVLAERIPMVSFTFGAPEKNTVDRLHAAGAEVIVTVTTPHEARTAVDVGADVLCVQGGDAGGHRGVFEDDADTPGGGTLLGTLAAVGLVAATVDVPLIAAGGLVTGADVAAVLSAGAAAAQFGTAFLLADEAGTAPAQRDELLAGTRDTALTRAFSGRPARGLVNRFLTEQSEHAPAAYPQLHHLTRPIRGAAGKEGDPEAMSLWAGQTYSLARPSPAADLVRTLADEARAAVAAAERRLGG